jgi:hypothetical protein
MDQAIETALQGGELDEFIGRPSGALRLSLQIEIAAAGQSIVASTLH